MTLVVEATSLIMVEEVETLVAITAMADTRRSMTHLVMAIIVVVAMITLHQPQTQVIIRQ